MRWRYLPEFDSLPEDWELVPLYLVADVMAGQSPSSEHYNERGEGLPFLQGNADFSDEYPSPKVWCTQPTKVCKAGATLVSVRAPVGELNRADQTYALGRGLAALEATNIDADYLHYGMHRWRRCLQRAAQGSTFDAVTARQFRQLLIPKPKGLEEQKAIASTLRAVDEAIAKTKDEIAATEQLKKALMQQLFTRGLPGKHQRFKQTKIGEIPEEWEVKPLMAHCGDYSCVRTGPFGVQLPPEAFDKTGLRMVNITDIGDGCLEFTTEAYVKDEVANYLSEYWLLENDLVFSRVASVGRVALIEEKHAPLIMSSNCIRLRPGSAFNSYFLMHVFINAESVSRQVVAASTGGNRAIVTPRFLRKMLIPCPSKEEQSEISLIIKSVEETINALSSELKSLGILKKSLLQNLLTGEVRVRV